MENNYCKCVNPIFEHNYSQDEYLGFGCIDCGRGLKPMTKREKRNIIIFISVVLILFVCWLIFIIYNLR